MKTYRPIVNGYHHDDVYADSAFEAAWDIACDILSPDGKREVCVGFESMDRYHYVATVTEVSQTISSDGTETTRMAIKVEKELI